MTTTVAGIVSRISPILKLTSGKLVFVELLRDEGDGRNREVIFISLSEDIIHERAMLELGHYYSFCGVQKCKWTKTEDNGINTIAVDQLWFIVNKNTTINRGAESRLDPFSDSAANVINTDLLRNILYPKNPYMRELKSTEEVTIEGKLLKQHKLGWLEIDMMMSNSPKKVCLFVSKCRSVDGSSAMRQGMKIQASFVLPVYLWTEFHGFATTVRSRIILKDEIVDNEVGQLCNIRSDNNHNSTTNLSATNMMSIHVPKEIKGRCHMYTSWRSYLDNKLKTSIDTKDTQNSNTEKLTAIIAFLHNNNVGTGPIIADAPCIPKLTEITAFGNVQMEFSNILYAQLFSVRAGHDMDWLSSQLVKICSCCDVSMLRAGLLKICSNGDDEGSAWSCQQYDLSVLATYGRGMFTVPDNEKLRAVIAAASSCTEKQNTAFVGSLLVEPAGWRPETSSIECPCGFMTAFCRAHDGAGKEVNIIIRNYYDEPHLFNAHNPGMGLGIIVVKSPQLLLEISPLPGVAGTLTIIAEAKRTLIVRESHTSLPNHDNVQGQLGKKRSLSAELAPASANNRAVAIGDFAFATDATQTISGVHPINRRANQGDEKCSQATTTMHVRQLHTTPWRNDGMFPASLVGVVVYKGLLLPDDNKVHPHQSSSSSSSSSSVANRKCCLILRDVMFADTVKVYLPVSIAGLAVVGMVVVLDNAMVMRPLNQKKLYLKHYEQKTQIGVRGIVNEFQLPILCKQSSTRYLEEEPDLHPAYITTPPRSLISRLIETRRDNRAFWTLLGRVVHVKKVTIALKCTKCISSNVTKCTGSFHCSYCNTKALLRPHWSATIAFDDGTGECLVQVEGSRVLQLLAHPSSESVHRLQDVREIVEVGSQQYGKICFDGWIAQQRRVAKEQCKTKSSGVLSIDQQLDDYYWDDELQDVVPRNSSNSNSSSSSSSKYSSATYGVAATRGDNDRDLYDPPHPEELMLEEYVDSYNELTPLIELQVKVLVEKADTSTSVGKNNSSNGSTGHGPNTDHVNTEINVDQSGTTKNPKNANPLTLAVAESNVLSGGPFKAINIKIQENNVDRPFMLALTSVPTFATKQRLTVEAVAVKILSGESIRLEAYKQLHAITERKNRLG